MTYAVQKSQMPSFEAASKGEGRIAYFGSRVQANAAYCFLPTAFCLLLHPALRRNK
jgi:hypothetical protein